MVPPTSAKGRSATARPPRAVYFFARRKVRAWSGLLPVAVAVAAERHLQLGADLGQHVGRVEIVPHPPQPIAVRLDAGDGAHRLAVLVRVPEDQEPFAAVQP